MSIQSVSAVQFKLTPITTKEDFWVQVNQHIQTSIKQGAKLVMFPEYLTASILALSPVLDHKGACEYISNFTEEYISGFQEISKKTGLTILGGTHLVKVGSEFYNTAHMFFPDGRIHTQRKVHLTPEERRSWKLSAGDSFSVVDTILGPTAILICYDIEFPESARIVADQGAKIILCPSYTDAAAGYYRVRYCSQARAIENQLYVALCGLVGEVPGVEQIDVACSQGGVFAPCDYPFPADGILAMGGFNQSDVVTATVNQEQITENRKKGNVAPYMDRRKDIYIGQT